MLELSLALLKNYVELAATLSRWNLVCALSHTQAPILAQKAWLQYFTRRKQLYCPIATNCIFTTGKCNHSVVRFLSPCLHTWYTFKISNESYLFDEIFSSVK